MSEREQSEKDLQQSIVQYLAVAAPKVLVYQFGKPGGHGALKGAVPVGWPDLVLVLRRTLPPEILFVEVKRPGGRLSMGQLAVRSELLEAGCAHYVWYSIGQVAETLRRHNVTLRCEP